MHLNKRKSTLKFTTSTQVHDAGKWRQVSFECFPQYALVKLKGTRTSYAIDYEALYQTAVKNHVARERKRK